MGTPKRKFNANISDMELDSVSHIHDSVATPSKMGRTPQLPPPTASMMRFSRDIRVVDPALNSSVFVDNPSPPQFKKQQTTSVAMELTGIQDYIPVSTPFKRTEFQFDVPELSSNALDTKALDKVFEDDANETFEEDQTTKLEVYVDPENEPPVVYSQESPLRKPLLQKQLSPVQEATQESSEIHPVTAPVVPSAAAQPSDHPSPVASVSTAPVRGIPSTPRHNSALTKRPARTPHRTPQRTPQLGPNRALQKTPSSKPFPTIQPTPTRRYSVSPNRRTPYKAQGVISIPSSPDRMASPMLRGSLRSEDESFMNMDPGRLESVDDLMVQLAIKDFNPVSVDDILPKKEIQLTDLSPQDEVAALTLQAEINKLIDEGYNLEAKIKRVAENMDVNAVMAKHHTDDRRERLELKHRMRSLYDHLQAKAELRVVEGELNMSRDIYDNLKALRAEYQARYADFEALRQQSKVVEEEITNLRNLHDDEAALTAQINELTCQVNSRFDRVKLRQQEITSRTVQNEKLERQWSSAEVRDITKEDQDEAWYRRQYFAKFETLRTLHGIDDIKFFASDGFSITLDGLEIVYANKRQSFELLTSNLLSEHYFKLLSNFKSLKANISVWKGYLAVRDQLKQIRRLGYSEWKNQEKTLIFKLSAKQGTIYIYFREENISVECDITDKALTEQVLRAPGVTAITILASKL